MLLVSNDSNSFMDYNNDYINSPGVEYECEIQIISGIFEFHNQADMGKYELPNFR